LEFTIIPRTVPSINHLKEKNYVHTLEESTIFENEKDRLRSLYFFAHSDIKNFLSLTLILTAS
jgi:hypothetical protein